MFCGRDELPPFTPKENKKKRITSGNKYGRYFLTFLQVHDSLCIVLQGVVCPPQAPVGQSFSDQIVGLRRHAQVLLLEDHGPLVVP